MNPSVQACVCVRMQTQRSPQIIFHTHFVRAHTHLKPHDSTETFKKSLTPLISLREDSGLVYWYLGGAEGLLIFTSQSHPGETYRHHFLSAWKL